MGQNLIPIPEDAPPPLSPVEAVQTIEFDRTKYALRLIASEPLVQQPTGICWDADGRLFVSELHGYNLEGQFDIEELNKTGQLDRIVRRLPAPPEAIAKAKANQYGIVKLLKDTNGDGVMDRAVVWADDLPPAIGLCAARDGVIVAAAPHIIYLGDPDKDGLPEERQILFTGFDEGVIERRINRPTWSYDGWIYFGRGRRCTVSGPNIPQPVELLEADFRIRPDGSAIESITGGTHTIGFALTTSGHRFTISTGGPGIFVAPIPWRYLERPSAAQLKRTLIDAADYSTIHQISNPHPWRQTRQEDPGFFDYYRERYGAGDSMAKGYFTSACSPLIYRDSVLPDLQGSYFACEPSGNIIHRANIQTIDDKLGLQRPAEENGREFLAARDVWFNPIGLAHTPRGTLAIIDFYREIIEDYSAIPRYLQQQYRLNHGADRGRLWELVPKDFQQSPLSNIRFSEKSNEAHVEALTSALFWERQTAQRLLYALSPEAFEQVQKKVGQIARSRESSVDSVVASLFLLQHFNVLTPADLHPLVDRKEFAIRCQLLRFSEPFLDDDEKLWSNAVAQTQSTNALVRIQAILSLGETERPEALPILTRLDEQDGHSPWLQTAIDASLPYSKSLAIADAESDRDALIAAADDILRREGDSNLPSEIADLADYTAALTREPNLERGKKLFTQVCANCHQIGDLGRNVGPNLRAEQGRSPESMLTEILFPNRQITASYETTVINANSGEVYAGILQSESPGGLTIRDISGTLHFIPRKDVKSMRPSNRSLMPSSLAAIPANDMAAIVHWLLKPQ